MNLRTNDRRSRVPAFKRVGTYFPLLIILGMAAPAMIYLAVMQSLGWSSPVVGVNAALAFIAQSSNTVILYESSTTKTYFAGIGGNYDTLVVPWKNYFVNRKLRYKEIQEPAKLRDHNDGVLILPSAVALGDDDRAEIAAFRARGGSVLATWATGSRTAKGDWAGWQFMESLGVKMLGEIPAAADVTNIILNGESPVTHKQLAGQRIPLSKTSEVLLRFKGEVVAARFMDWARITNPERRDEGAILFSEATPGASRSVVYAFSESVWESHPMVVYDVIDDSIQWLKREPSIVRAAWPNGKRASQVIEMDTEDGFPNAPTFAAMMRAIDYRATFYVLTSVGKRFPEIMTQLARDFEVGYHADVHDGFKGQPANVQEQRMQNMRADMASMIGDTKNVTGFRAPFESYDATTEKLLPKFGIRHHTSDPGRTDARLPFFTKMDGVEPEDALVVLPRTQRDDINVANQSLTVAQTTSELISDFDLAVNTGSLGLLSVHSQNFSPDGTLAQAMPGFIARIKERRDQVWLASAGQVADWWRQRDRVKLSTVDSGKRLEFNITITGTEPVSGTSLVVMLPQKGVLPIVKSMKIGSVTSTVTKIDDYRATIQFATLKPGNYAYQATFENK